MIHRSAEQSSSATRLLELREALGCSQRELAREFGVTGPAIAQWETGARTVPGPVLKLLALFERELTGAPPDQAPSSGARLVQSSSAALAWAVVKSFGPMSGDGPVAQRVREYAARRFVRESCRLRGLAMKWAQMLWSVAPLLDEAEARAVDELRSIGRSMGTARAVRVFTDDIGRAPGRCFAEWEYEPFAVASIGQVHRAKALTGEPLAVKIQDPAAAANMQADLGPSRWIQLLARTMRPTARADEALQHLQELFLAECDYVQEAAAMEAFREMFRDVPGVVIPRVWPAFSGSNVITMSFEDGRTLESFRSASKAERDRAGASLWEFYYRSMFDRGLFQSDAGPGNFLFRSNEVVFLDFGRIQALEPSFLDLWKRTSRAFVERDEREVGRCMYELGWVASETTTLGAPSTTELIWLWMAPCLVEGGFRFTPAYLRKLWDAFREDSARAHAHYSKGTVFMPQLLLGLTGLLTQLGATVDCRSRFLRSVYPAGATPPPPVSLDELLRYGIDLRAWGCAEAETPPAEVRRR